MLEHGVDFTLVKGDWRVGLEDEGDGEYYNYYRRSSLKFDNWGEACMEVGYFTKRPELPIKTMIFYKGTTLAKTIKGTKNNHSYLQNKFWSRGIIKIKPFREWKTKKLFFKRRLCKTMIFKIVITFF